MAFLRDIIENKKEEVKCEKLKESLDDLKAIIKTLPPTKDFLRQMQKPGINIIAETKVKSPSMTDVNEKDMIQLADEYQANNGKIAAISVLTDKTYFAGSKEIMREIRKRTDKPILRKDFILDEYQVYQSRAYGADAILLMSAVLTPEEMEEFVNLSNKLGMKCLVEFSTKEDRAKIPSNVEIYGRNYRKLTLDTKLGPKGANFSDPKIYDEINASPTLIDDLPKEAVKVAESQIKTRENIDSLRSKGYNAFLIGSSIAFAKNVNKTLSDLTSC